MPWPVYYLISGEAFATGLWMSLMAILLTLHHRAWTLRIALMLHIIGVLLIISSSSTMKITGHVLTIAWPFLAMLQARQATQQPSKTDAQKQPDALGFTPRQRRSAHYSTVFTGVVLTALFLGTSFENARIPTVVLPPNTPIHVIGDSLSAASDDGTPTWPELLAEQIGRPVTVHARAGSTTADAMKQATGLPADCCVLIEIGGNDLLSGESSTRFADDLDTLLQKVCADGRAVVMFELPLPPFCNGYALAQKRLSSEFDTRLIPRGVLASVFYPDANTVDSLHLSAAGHRDLADRLRPIFERSGR